MKKKFILLIPLLSLFTANAPLSYNPYLVDSRFVEEKLTQVEPLTIMWDLGDTLLQVNRMSFVGKLGPLDAAMYIAFDAHFNTHQIQARLFEILEILGGPQECPDQFKCTDGKGFTLPNIMALWLAGSFDQDPQSFIQELEAGIDHLFQEGYFLNKREYRLIRKAVRAMFDPETLVKCQTILKPMFKLLEKINYDKHTCMILSNWDAASFELFLESPCGQKLMQYIDPKNIVISGAIGLNKPHPSFFEYVLYTYKLNPQRCILIDNDPANCATARACGIHTINFTGNVKDVELELTNRNILN